jgi:hypothetical protein
MKTLNLQVATVMVIGLGLCSSWLVDAKEGACQNPPDHATWESKKSVFASDLETCGRECWGDSSCVTSCIVKLDGYSIPCANCFGGLVSCTKSNCMSKCLFGHSVACIDCTKTTCTPKFSTCSGIPMDDVPDAENMKNKNKHGKEELLLQEM